MSYHDACSKIPIGVVKNTATLDDPTLKNHKYYAKKSNVNTILFLCYCFGIW